MPSTLTIYSAIANNGTGVVDLVKSGSGAITLRGASNFTGKMVINGGTLYLSAANSFTGGVLINGGTLSTSLASSFGSNTFTMIGGTFAYTGNTNVTGALVLGPGNSTISVGGWDGTRALFKSFSTTGSGVRSLTVTGGTTRGAANFTSKITDATDGATSLIVNLGVDAAMVQLTHTSNSYSGSTTISRGILQYSAAGALSPNTNIVFNATGTNRAILESSVATPVTFDDAVGYGANQIHWEGNGGFSNNSTSVGKDAWIVNLGGAGATLTWGSGGFVPTGSYLQFGSSASNTSLSNVGTIDFRNSIELGSLVRTIDVQTQLIYGKAAFAGHTILDAVMSGNLTSSSGGGILKTGTGALMLTGAGNSTSTNTTVTVNQGTLLFGSAAAIPGSGSNITLSTSSATVTAIGVQNDTNPIQTFAGRITNGTTATSAFLLSADSGEDMNFTNYSNMRLAGLGGTWNGTSWVLPSHITTYTGTLTPGSSGYRFGGVTLAVISGAFNTHWISALSVASSLTGSSAADITHGVTNLLNSNSYSGGTTFGSTIAQSSVGIGSNSAFGTGQITMVNTQTNAFGAVNGDHVVANKIVFGAGVTGAFIASGDALSDGISNGAAGTSWGALTYLGTIDYNLRGSALSLYSRGGHPVLIMGDLYNSAQKTGVTLTTSSSAGLFSFLATSANGGTAKSYTGNTTITGSTNGTTIVIDSNDSFGVYNNSGANQGDLVFTGTSNSIGVLRVQPGTTDVVTLGTYNADSGVSKARTISISNTSVEFRVGAGSQLVITGAIKQTGVNTKARSLTKSDVGTLTLQGPNGSYSGANSFANTLQIYGGTLQLDSVNFANTTDRFFSESTLLPVVFGAASNSIFSTGGTLEIVSNSSSATLGGPVSQSFGAVTVNPGANAIKLTQNGTAAIALTLGTITRATGSTLAISAPNGYTIASTTAAIGGLVNGATTWGTDDWAAANGTVISKYTAYTAVASGGAIANSYDKNVDLAGNATLAASTVYANTLRYRRHLRGHDRPGQRESVFGLRRYVHCHDRRRCP